MRFPASQVVLAHDCLSRERVAPVAIPGHCPGLRYGADGEAASGPQVCRRRALTASELTCGARLLDLAWPVLWAGIIPE